MKPCSAAKSRAFTPRPAAQRERNAAEQISARQVTDPQSLAVRYDGFAGGVKVGETAPDHLPDDFGFRKSSGRVVEFRGEFSVANVLNDAGKITCP
ncbi:MAG: hypothetical protein LBS35_14195 [Synergistaceae bacterium]|jgi:hypothetical protein|nr:hypothetical protein [Synergistaceae bacterium]